MTTIDLDPSRQGRLAQKNRAISNLKFSPDGKLTKVGALPVSMSVPTLAYQEKDSSTVMTYCRQSTWPKFDLTQYTQFIPATVGLTAHVDNPHQAMVVQRRSEHKKVTFRKPKRNTKVWAVLEGCLDNRPIGELVYLCAPVMAPTELPLSEIALDLLDVDEEVPEIDLSEAFDTEALDAEDDGGGKMPAVTTARHTDSSNIEDIDFLGHPDGGIPGLQSHELPPKLVQANECLKNKCCNC